MIESHNQGLDRMALNGGWAPGISDDQCDELEVDCVKDRYGEPERGGVNGSR
jgi:hypothetical protein